MENNSSFRTLTKFSHINKVVETKDFRILFVTLMSVIFLFSVAGNVFTCYVIVTRKLLKKNIWTYLFILSLADTAMILLSTPITLVGTFYNQALSISWLCGFSVSSMVFCGTFSIYTMVAISIYKFNHISRPLALLADSGMRSFIGYIVLTTTIALCIISPPAFGFSGFVHFPGRKWCSIWSIKERTQSKVLLIIFYIFDYVIPVVIIVSTSTRTFIVFRKHNKTTKEIRRMTSDEMIAENRAMFQTLFLIVFFFICLWTPLSLYVLFNAIGIEMPLIISHIAYIMMFLQGCVNPIIYCYKHPVFKKVLRTTLRGRRHYSISRPPISHQIHQQESNPNDDDLSSSRNKCKEITSSVNREEDGNKGQGENSHKNKFKKRYNQDVNNVITTPKSKGKIKRGKEKLSKEFLMLSTHSNPYYISGKEINKEKHS